VETVLIGTDEDALLYLKAKVCPSQSLNKTWYEAWISFKTNGALTDAGCECMAGKGRACSHVAAILFKVQAAHAAGLTSSTCTDNVCAWNKGRSGNVTPLPLGKMDFKRPKASSLPDPLGIIPTPISKNRISGFETEEEYLNQIKSTGLQSIFSAEGSLLQFTFSKMESPAFHGSHDDNQCNACSAFYGSYVNVSEAIITRIRNETIEQSESALWKESRSLRITASTAHSVPKRKETDPLSFLLGHVYPTFTGNSATVHGIASEDFVRTTIEAKTKIPISKVGVVISKEMPWLCGSPDGIFGDTLLEIKSPTNIDLKGFMKNPRKYDTHFNPVDATFSLSKTGNRGYYLQVQLTMFVLNVTKCMFVFYLQQSNILIDIIVDFDEAFVAVELRKLKCFYFTHMLPFLASQHRVNALQLLETIKVLN